MSPNANRPGRFKPSTRTPAWLRRARRALNLTQTELGAALGISKTEVYRKEAGRTAIPLYVEAGVLEMLEKAGELGEKKS